MGRWMMQANSWLAGINQQTRSADFKQTNNEVHTPYTVESSNSSQSVATNVVSGWLKAPHFRSNLFFRAGMTAGGSSKQKKQMENQLKISE